MRKAVGFIPSPSTQSLLSMLIIGPTLTKCRGSQLLGNVLIYQSTIFPKYFYQMMNLLLRVIDLTFLSSYLMKPKPVTSVFH